MTGGKGRGSQAQKAPNTGRNNQTAAKKKARPAPQKTTAGRPKAKAKKATQSGRLTRYKIAASDAPSRVEKCEFLRAFTYKSPLSMITLQPGESAPTTSAPHLDEEEFASGTLFLFLPQYAADQLLVVDTPTFAQHFPSQTLAAFSNPGGTSHMGLAVSTSPPMGLFNADSDQARCMAINGSLVFQSEFGGCNGILRWKRYTLRDSLRTPAELLIELKAGVQGVLRKTLSGSDTVVMHAGVHNRNHLSQYTESLANHWGYVPNEHAATTAKGLSPLSGWVFTITNVSATAFMPAPTIHLAGQVRIQRELTMATAYLSDDSPAIDPEQLSHLKRNEKATYSLRGRVEDLRSAADAVTALGKTAITLLSVRQAARAAHA